MEQNTSNETSCRSSLDLFTLKVVIAWFIICLPGNIFPIICIYGTNDTYIPSSHQKQIKFSRNENFLNYSSNAQQNVTNFFWNQILIHKDLKNDAENVSTFYINELLMI